MSADLDFIKSAVILCLAVVCTACNRTFDTSVLVGSIATMIVIHNLYPPCVVRYYYDKNNVFLNVEKYVKKAANLAAFMLHIKDKGVLNEPFYIFRTFQRKYQQICLRDKLFRRKRQTFQQLQQGFCICRE